MRHRVSHRKLGRVTEHRIAMLRNQAAALILHERIETTVPKAKELRPFVERIITLAKRGIAAGDANGQSLHARRMVLRDIQDRDVVGKLFDTIAPRFEARPGGYTRILRIGFRRGDSAEVAQIELVGSEFNPNAVSPVGAVGLTQLMLPTARYFDKSVTRAKLFDPETNLRIGFRYLRGLVKSYKGDLKLALLVYNRGPVAVEHALTTGVDPANGYDRAILKGYEGKGLVE